MPAVISSRSDTAVVLVIERWLEYLVAEEYPEALAMLAASELWTPELLQRVIFNYGFIEPHPRGTTFVVTPVATATGDGPRVQVTWFGEPTQGAVGYARYDLPLNGEWSDVTASFDILETPEGLTLALDDVHVM
jgi:hypothetical protein